MSAKPRTLILLLGTWVTCADADVTVRGRLQSYYESVSQRHDVALSMPSLPSSSWVTETAITGELRSQNLSVVIAGYASAGSGSNGLLTEGYGSLIFGGGWRLLAGVKREVWGNGIGWNPSNVLDNEVLFDKKKWRTRPFDGIAGREMVKASWTTATGEYAFYALPILKDPWGNEKAGWEWAARATWLVGELEVNAGVVETVSGAPTEMSRKSAALWASAPWSDRITVFGDLAVAFRNPYHYPANDLRDPPSDAHAPVISGLLGANVRLWGEMLLRGEFSYNGYGYSDSERARYLEGLIASAQQADFVTLGRWGATYQRYLLSRRYIGVTLSRQGVADLDWRLSLAYGADDSSYSPSVAAAYHITPRLDVFTELSYDGGRQRLAELRHQPVARRVMTGVTWYF